ncbi:hypothetical protein NQZ68_022772 [Dissostichus eleginoides]|nr:hypothetical protein NQZ68_022772 [Dissostichus eleginoides]
MNNRFWLRLSKAGPRCSKILSEPVACHSSAKTGSHLWNTPCLPIGAEWDAGLSGVQDQSVHRAQEHRWVSPGDNPHIACQAGFHSYFTSKLWATLVSQLHFV